MALDVYKAVTARIIELLDRGTVPWRHPIRGGRGERAFPTSLASRRAYRGINVFLLAVTAWLEGYESPYWLTYVQARKMGGHVRKGEKGSLVVLWKQYATQDKESGEGITVPVLRHYTVFNAEQCEGVEAPVSTIASGQGEATEFAPIEAASAIVERYQAGPRIDHKGDRAFYEPRADLVCIPEPDRFVDPGSYYATLFHELVHSTGHSSRLDRGLDENLSAFGSVDYSKEEMVAEMGAAFLAAAAGIGQATIEQSAAYIDGWRTRVAADTRLVVQSAGMAQRAADWILGERPGDP
ncbi:MAG: zincin-like metallopeptidase domain-containing protein [Planctomycetota bacterium]